jgi:hypothetical protein
MLSREESCINPMYLFPYAGNDMLQNSMATPNAREHNVGWSIPSVVLEMTELED